MCALKVHVSFRPPQFEAIKSDVDAGTVAVERIALVRERVIPVHDQISAFLSQSQRSSIRGHGKKPNSIVNLFECLYKYVFSVIQKKTISVLVRVNQAENNAVNSVTIQTQNLQNKARSKLSKAVKIVVVVVVDASLQFVASVEVRADGVSDLVEPVFQKSLFVIPAEITEGN